LSPCCKMVGSAAVCSPRDSSTAEAAAQGIC
jgi:hypothetical protein